MKAPLIIDFRAMRLVGLNQQTTLDAQNPFELWRNFKKRLSEIHNRKSEVFYSIQVFNDKTDFGNFTPQTKFEKWAAVEITDVAAEIPEGMTELRIDSGKYAVFIHKGLPSEFSKTAEFIYGHWLPPAPYVLDNKPHFEVMQADYYPNDPNATEEVWVPIKDKI